MIQIAGGIVLAWFFLVALGTCASCTCAALG